MNTPETSLGYWPFDSVHQVLQVLAALHDTLAGNEQRAVQIAHLALKERTKPGVPDAVVSFGIEVEKMLCKALGREWSAARISIKTLVLEIERRLAWRRYDAATDWPESPIVAANIKRVEARNRELREILEKLPPGSNPLSAVSTKTLLEELWRRADAAD